MLFSSTKKRHAVPGILACCALACTLMASGCGQSFSDAAQALNDGVKSDMAQLTNLTSETATSLFASDYTQDLVAAGVDPLDVYGPMFASLAYEVSSINIEDNTAHVLVDISNKDLNQVFQDYTTKVTNELATAETRDALAAMDDAALTAHLATVLESCLARPDVAVVSQTVELVYAKDGSVWKLQDSNELVRALLGGLDPAQASAVREDELVEASDPVSPEQGDVQSEPTDQAQEGDVSVEGGEQASAEFDQQ